MNEQTNNTQAAFMEVTMRKVETQDKKIAAIEEIVKHISGNTELIQKLLTTVEELHSDVKSNSLQPETIQNLSVQLELATTLLKQPILNKVLHHHHIPKLTWISAGLFVAFALVCSGWYLTNSRLNNFISNDTKYRWLRLDTSQRSLQIYLYRVDSLYNILPDMRKNVIETEEEYRLNFERLQKAGRLKAEAKELEKIAPRKKGHVK
ncbi:MAG: hypothetical protein JWP81_1554 [Ferruginibacter sp.]|nr:hypothetical protein [Ferruginibacter sp.]